MTANSHILLFILIFLSVSAYSGSNLCLNCHKGIEDIRDPNSKMMITINDLAKKSGYENNNCIVCHGGNPETIEVHAAHRGTISYFINNDGPKNFYPDPGSSWINENTCGMCHNEQIMAQMNSLMMTEQGKIQGTLWGFGGMEGYEHNIGNYPTKNVSIQDRLGTMAYKQYMNVISGKNPQVYPQEMRPLPPAPTAEEATKNPQLAAYTYLRQECQRCHTGSKGRKRRGDYRGTGCSSCHIPYSNNGFYEGEDHSISHDEAGHMLVHSIQSTRDALVNVHGTHYSGISVETCTTCHNRGKRIGVSYQGLMETEYESTFDEQGNGQPGLHSKHYMHLQEDLHYKLGMLCQDCHTSIDIHGDGFLSGSTLAPVEIECQDCHGTTKLYPWELPLGYGDEFETTPSTGQARGVDIIIPEYLKKGMFYDPEDGYLRSARGNPFVNVVKTGSDVIVHLASGKDLNLIPLKKLKAENKLSQAGTVAMDQISIHTDRMECYTCHATWAPQCYGCHVKIDYSNGAQHVDWLAAAGDHDEQGRTGCMRDNLNNYMIDGEVTETRSYLRWEDPPLSQNGEGRISPTIPGCQTTITVIGINGKAVLQNHIFKIPNVEGAGNGGQLGIDMSPVHPHTVQKEARSCESCHTSKTAAGYGIEGGKFISDPSEDFIVDLMTADGKVLPERVTSQIPGIPNLHMDWSRFVDENGKQLQTVGHHFNLSGPLDSTARAKLDRSGVCLSCHKSIPEKDLAVSLMTHAAAVANIQIDNKMHNSILNKLLLFSAWGQILGGLIVGLAIAFLIYRFISSRRTD